MVTNIIKLIYFLVMYTITLIKKRYSTVYNPFKLVHNFFLTCDNKIDTLIEKINKWSK